jgi:uncharacterized membrane protein YbhN (UPF0104 family)
MTIRSTVFAMYLMFIIAARSSSSHFKSNTQDKKLHLLSGLADSAGIWIVFAFAILFLIPSVGFAFTDDNIVLTTLGAVESIILAMLVVSSCVAATTPMVANNEAEALVLQEDTAATRNNNGETA